MYRPIYYTEENALHTVLKRSNLYGDFSNKHETTVSIHVNNIDRYF